jgi:sugar transferase (PEP-CTERM/EpsH1 system associated)
MAGKQLLMNILFIANRFPYPPYRGDKLKIYNIARRLKARGHTLYLITFIQDKKDYKYIRELEKVFEKTEFVYLPKKKSLTNILKNVFSGDPLQVLYFRSKELKEKVNRFISENSIDIIHTQHLRMAQYAADIKSIPRILDLPDAYSMYWQRRYRLKKSPFSKLFAYIEYKKILNYEDILKKFNLSLVCSEEDKQYLKKTRGINNIEILPNGVDTDEFARNGTGYDIDNRIIFTGNMSYSPNIDAVLYFVNEIFPGLLHKFPNLKLYIAGQSPGSKIKELESENIVVTGFVKDLSREYELSTVAVSPVRYGAGTLNKVLEPMAMGVPVVMSKVGFEGLEIRSGEGAVIAETKDDFIREISRLLSSKEARTEVGQKGLEIVRARFSWDAVVTRLEGYMKDAVQSFKTDKEN